VLILNHYAFHIGDYIKDTAHLTDAEDLAYRRLLDLYYTLEGPIPLDVKQVCRRARIAQDVAEQILSEFFTQTSDGFHHSRCDAELKAIYAKSESARISAEKRWEKQKNANAMRTHSEGNATHNPLPITQLEPLSDSQANTDPMHLEDCKAKASTADAKAVIDFLNLRTGRKYRHTKSNLDPILARMREGYTVQEIRTVTMRKVNDWLTDEKMNEYLRPATLYTARNFNSYAGILT
jgi:uncharacterized phage protein (TIGR02220 family)